MNRVIRPLSEDFLYCSPENPERTLYLVLRQGGGCYPKVKMEPLKKETGHVPTKRK